MSDQGASDAGMDVGGAFVGPVWTSLAQGKQSIGGSFIDPGNIRGIFHHGSNVIPETPLEKEQAQIAKQQWADYQKRWMPVIDYYKKRTDRGLGSKKQLAAGEANTDVQSKFGDAGQALSTNLRSRGIETGSGKDIAAMGKLSDSKAAALGGGLTTSQDVVDQQYENALQSIVGIGRGERMQADQSLNTLAGLSGQQAASNAEAAAQDAAGLGQALGVGLGGAAAYGLRRAQGPGVTPPGYPQQQQQDPVTGIG